MFHKPISVIRLASSAIGAQATGSAANFAYNLFLMAYLEKSEFGAFTVCFAVMIFVAGFYQALFTTQFIVLAPEQPESFPSDTFSTLIWSSAILIGLSAAILVGLKLIGGDLSLGLAVLVASIGFGLKEFLFRQALTSGQSLGAFSINATLALSIFAAILLGIATKLPPTLTTAVWIYGGLCLLAGGVGYLMSPVTLRRFDWPNYRHTFGLLFKGGQWASLSHVVFSLRGNAQTIVVTPLLGTAAIADINAARLLISPVMIMVQSLSTLILAHLSRKVVQGGVAAMQKAQIRTGALLLVLGATLLLPLVVLWPVIEHRVLPEAYHGLRAYFIAWSVVLGATFLRVMVDLGAQSLKRFADIAGFAVIAAVVAISLAWAFTILLGPLYSIYAIAASELVLAALIAVFVLRRPRAKPNTAKPETENCP